MAKQAELTITLLQEQLEQLQKLAASRGHSASLLASEALAAYLAVQEWQVAAIDAGVAAADAGGSTIEHQEVDDWLRSWGTEHESPPPA